MASLVNSSLDLIRRHKSPKHPRLHSRWGDVAISAPTEGSWSRFDNPIPREKQIYGPGFVPGLDGDDKEVLLLDDESDDEPPPPPPTEKRSEKETSSGSSIASLKPRRLTRILLPSSVNTTAKKVEETVKPPVEFEYKPVRPNYAQEVAKKKNDGDRARFRYVPASDKYLQNLENDLKQPTDISKPLPRSPRSRSCDPSIWTGAVPAERRNQRYHPPHHHHHHHQPESIPSGPPQTMPATMPRRSASRGSREDPSRGRIPPKQASPSPSPSSSPSSSSSSSSSSIPLRSRSAAVKPSRRRTMTLTMVSDPEELW